jgi:hypothetical protein
MPVSRFGKSMPNRLIVNKLDRLTLVSKGRSRAKHPALRDNVVEVVKAVPEGPQTFEEYLAVALHGVSTDFHTSLHNDLDAVDVALRAILHGKS